MKKEKLDISLHSATEKDFDFAYKAKKEALSIFPELKEIWNEEEQIEKIRSKFLGNYLKIIIVDGKSIGTVGLVDEGENFRISQFFILPDFHSMGIGSFIIEEYIQHSQREKKDIHVRVGQYQLSAIQFYKKHGFQDSGRALDSSGCYYFIRRYLG